MTTVTPGYTIREDWPTTAAAVAADDFNRATSGAIGDEQLGQTWTVVAGTGNGVLATSPNHNYSAAGGLRCEIADTTRHEYLLVRKAWLTPVDPCRRHIATIRRSFNYPGPLTCKREALESDLAVNRAISAHYRVAEELGPYLVMRRAGGS